MNNNQQFQLSPLAQKIIEVISHKPEQIFGKKISVDPVVAEVASFYEKIRNAMEYQEEEVVFRVAIERILKRKLLLGSNGSKIAEPLVRELAWAKYFPDKTIPEAIVEEIAEKINLYIKLYEEAPKIYDLNKKVLHEWIIDVMSSDIALTINPNKNIQIVSSFMYHVLAGKIKIVGDDEENRNALIFVNIRRAVAKEDKPFLRYHLFHQYFGNFEQSSFDLVLGNFLKGYQKIEQAFHHPLNEQIYTYVRKRCAPFIILKKMLDEYKDQTTAILQDPQLLTSVVSKICSDSYQGIHKRVRTAIVRSVIFLFATKAVFAILIEGSIERQFFGHVSWVFLGATIITPPFLMFLSMFFISVPDKNNTKVILDKLKSILYDPQISEIEEVSISLHAKKAPFLNTVFIALWFLVFGAGIWGIVSVLRIFNINFISQIIFIFFLIVVSFLIFRINQSSKVYDAHENSGGFLSILFYFAFMPFVLLGKRLTVSFSKINIFLLLFDFVIETPFKTIFGFFEKWFTFMRSQRDKLD